MSARYGHSDDSLCRGSAARLATGLRDARLRRHACLMRRRGLLCAPLRDCCGSVAVPFMVGFIVAGCDEPGVAVALANDLGMVDQTAGQRKAHCAADKRADGVKESLWLMIRRRAGRR